MFRRIYFEMKYQTLRDKIIQSIEKCDNDSVFDTQNNWREEEDIERLDPVKKKLIVIQFWE